MREEFDTIEASMTFTCNHSAVIVVGGEHYDLAKVAVLVVPGRSDTLVTAHLQHPIEGTAGSDILLLVGGLEPIALCPRDQDQENGLGRSLNGHLRLTGVSPSDNAKLIGLIQVVASRLGGTSPLQE
jgi:hypothetical protein